MPRQRKDNRLARLLFIGSAKVHAPLARALRAHYRLSYGGARPKKITDTVLRRYAGVLVEEASLRTWPADLHRRMAWLAARLPLILLTRSHEPVPTDLISELHAYHALPYTDRSWPYVARSIVDVLGQRDLERDNGLLRTIVEYASDSMFAVDLHGRVALANRASVRTFGYPRSRLLGMALEQLFPLDTAAARDLHHSLSHRTQWSGEVAARCHDGSRIAAHVALSFARDAEGAITAAIIVARPIPEEQRLLHHLAELSITDDLTGVYNVRYLRSRLHYEVLRARRYEHALSLLMLDVDHFKVINDTHGHHVGDVVLQQFAEMVREATRDVDLVARYGGDEFVVILPNTDLKGAVVCAEKLRRRVETTPFSVEGRLLRVTASIGAAELTHDMNHAEELLQRADLAMFRAKRRGRNCVHVTETAPIPL